MVHTNQFSRGNLPHWLVSDRPYFVTICLHGVLPKTKREEYWSEYQSLQADDSSRSLDKDRFLQLEKILDSATDYNWMSQQNVADLVFSNLAWLEDARGWCIYAASIMPNHMHMVIRNHTGRNHKLIEDLAQFKGYSGRQCNELLSRDGSFWARESFDHWCRDDAKVLSAIRYTLNNPVKAGLVPEWHLWSWSRVHEDFREVMDAAGS